MLLLSKRRKLKRKIIEDCRRLKLKITTHKRRFFYNFSLLIFFLNIKRHLSLNSKERRRKNYVFIKTFFIYETISFFYCLFTYSLQSLLSSHHISLLMPIIIVKKQKIFLLFFEWIREKKMAKAEAATPTSGSSKDKISSLLSFKNRFLVLGKRDFSCLFLRCLTRNCVL